MAKKGRLYALRQEHNPLVYLCGPWLQIKESKKADLIKDYYIDHMARGQMIANWEGRLNKREPEVHRHECEDFTFPDGMEYPVWLLDIRLRESG
mgnify:FL=1